MRKVRRLFSKIAEMLLFASPVVSFEGDYLLILSYLLPISLP